MTGTGLVHIYYGDGKGKTTAGIGQVVRTAGCGYRVLVFQFLKDNSSNERNILTQIENITLMSGRGSEKFVFQMNESEKKEAAAYYTERFKELIMQSEAYDVLFLDEIICAVELGLLDENLLISFLNNRKKGLEVILTGNVPSAALMGISDYITEMKKVRHPYDAGQNARNGIEQ